MTEAVCNLSMNNLTTNKFKQLKSSATEERPVCAVSWPFIHCLHNLFTTSLDKKKTYLDCQQTANICPAATQHRVQLCSSGFENSKFGCFVFVLFGKQQCGICTSVSVSRQTLMFRLMKSSSNCLYPRFVPFFFVCLFFFVFAKPITRPVCKEGIQGFISL